MHSEILPDCSSEAIQKYLNDLLPVEDAGRLENHLDSCEDCRRQMESLAADAAFWKQANRCLGHRPGDADQTIDVRTGSSDAVPPDSVRLFVENYLGSAERASDIGSLDGYGVESVIGQGASGIVLKARDSALRRDVAIKVLRPTLSEHTTAFKRFHREAQAMASVDHPNVIEVYAVSEHRGLPYLVMPLIDGSSLGVLAEKSAPLPLPQILSFGRQIAEGLSAAHKVGLIHRDIKPSNILLDKPTGQLVITDFGLALGADSPSLTESGVVPGTPTYMSPEQARGQTVTQSTDLFSTGSVLYLLATGQPAFSAETVYGTLRLIGESDTRPVRELNSELPEFFQQLLKSLHEKDPATRLSSAGTLAGLLKQLQDHLDDPVRVLVPDCLTAQNSRREFETGKAAPVTAGQRESVLKSSRNSRRLRLAVPVSGLLLALVMYSLTLMPKKPKESAGVAKTEEIAPPAATPASEESVTAQTSHESKRCVFPTDRPSAFLTVLSARLPEGSCEVDGIVTIHARDSGAGAQQLLLDLDLGMSQSFAMAGDSGQRNGTRWWRVQRAGAVAMTIANNGEILERGGEFFLPMDLGSLTDFLFPGPTGPDARRSVDSERQTEAWVQPLSRDLKTDVRRGKVTSVFDTKTGQLHSVSVNLTAAGESGEEGRQLPIGLSFQWLSEEELSAWHQRNSNHVEESTSLSAQLTDDEQTQFLTDMHNNQHVLYWLQQLEKRDAAQFAPEIVDSIVLLQDHPSATCSTLARRITKMIPDALLNPFREAD